MLASSPLNMRHQDVSRQLSTASSSEGELFKAIDGVKDETYRSAESSRAKVFQSRTITELVVGSRAIQSSMIDLYGKKVLVFVFSVSRPQSPFYMQNADEGTRI